MDDLISRQAVLDLISKGYLVSNSNCAKCRKWVEDIPSADAAPVKISHWNLREPDCYECLECHAVLEGDALRWNNNYYCYHCGAKMENPYVPNEEGA